MNAMAMFYGFVSSILVLLMKKVKLNELRHYFVSESAN